MKYILRKSLLYKSAVEYGDFTINHIEGCSHGCLYPCYAMLMAKRFGKVNSYKDWISPKLVKNSIVLLKNEIPKYKRKIRFVHFSFSTDPFMCGFKESSNLSLELIKMLNVESLKCTVLTKGILPIQLGDLSKKNEYGITLVSLNENFRKKFEPFTANYKERIDSLFYLHKKGFRTWVSIEPFPTPNIINQKIDVLLDSISFVDRIIFGRMNYNSLISRFKNYKNFYKDLGSQIIEYSKKEGKEYLIKNGTMA